MAFATEDPREISILMMLGDLSPTWEEIDWDALDSSYIFAAISLISAELAEVKVEITLSVAGCPGREVLKLRASGPYQEKVDELIERHALSRADWVLDPSKRRLRGSITQKYLITHWRFSRRAIELGLDRARVLQVEAPKIAREYTAILDNQEFPGTTTPWIELDSVTSTGSIGPSDSEPVFYWNGEGHRLTEKAIELARALWMGPTTFEELGEIVWGSNETPDNRIKTAISRLNNSLAEHGVPIEWTCDSGHVFRTD